MFNSNEEFKNAQKVSALRAFFYNITDFLRGLYDFGCEVPCFGPIFSKIDRKFIKFLFVGVLNTIFGYSLYAIMLFTFTNWHFTPHLIAYLKQMVAFLSLSKETLALTIQWFIGILWNFQTTGRIVFKNSENSLIWKFFGTYIISYFVNKMLLEFLLKLGLNGYIAQALIVLPVAILSFLMMKFFVFKKC